MSTECEAVHVLARSLERHSFPFSEASIPANGIYVLFEDGEHDHEGDRIVRVGTHTGDKQLRSRLKQHFLKENKDRSIFRKNIGRALLKQANDPFLVHWNLDLTTKKLREKFYHQVDLEYQKTIEARVTEYIRSSFSFCVFEVNDKSERLSIESKIISTVSKCGHCRPSKNWLGNWSPKDKIVKSGLWLVNELYKTSFDAPGIKGLSKLIKS